MQAALRTGRFRFRNSFFMNLQILQIEVVSAEENWQPYWVDARSREAGIFTTYRGSADAKPGFIPELKSGDS